MYRFPDPLDENALRPLMADARYGDPSHPEHPYYRKFVDRAFALVYPDPPRDGAGNFVIDPRDPPKPQVITGGAEFRLWEDDDGRDQARASSSFDWPKTPLHSRLSTTTDGTRLDLGRVGESDDYRSRNEQRDPATRSLATVGSTTEQRALHMPVEPDVEYRDASRSWPAGAPGGDINLLEPDQALDRHQVQDENDPERVRARAYAENVRAREQTEIDALHPAYVNELGRAESESTGGYRARNPAGGGLGALGRYQLRQPALRDIGLVDKNGNWICSTISGQRICSESDFLNNPRVQDIALARYTEKLRQQMTRNGVLSQVGTTIDTGSMQFPINYAGLHAAAHFAGADGLRHYLDHVAENGGKSEVGSVPYRAFMGPAATPEREREVAEAWRKEIDKRLTTFVSHTSPWQRSR